MPGGARCVPATAGGPAVNRIPGGLQPARHPPEGVEPVTDFEAERYLGRWYEIARLDHRFERGLSAVTAEYAWREDGGVSVLNRGFKEDKGAWDDIEGKAYFIGAPDVGFPQGLLFRTLLRWLSHHGPGRGRRRITATR